MPKKSLSSLLACNCFVQSRFTNRFVHDCEARVKKFDKRSKKGTFEQASTVEGGSTVQQKITFLGVTASDCLSFLNFQTFFYAYFFRKNRLFASDCFSKSSRGKIIEITCHFIIFQTFFLAFKGPLKGIKILFRLF